TQQTEPHRKSSNRYADRSPETPGPSPASASKRTRLDQVGSPEKRCRRSDQPPAPPFFRSIALEITNWTCSAIDNFRCGFCGLDPNSPGRGIRNGFAFLPDECAR